MLKRETSMEKQLWSVGGLWQEKVLPWTPFFPRHHQRMRADSFTLLLDECAGGLYIYPILPHTELL